jgi:hypothetical protein
MGPREVRRSKWLSARAEPQRRSYHSNAFSDHANGADGGRWTGEEVPGPAKGRSPRPRTRSCQRALISQVRRPRSPRDRFGFTSWHVQDAGEQVCPRI